MNILYLQSKIHLCPHQNTEVTEIFHSMTKTIKYKQHTNNIDLKVNLWRTNIIQCLKLTPTLTES